MNSFDLFNFVSGVVRPKENLKLKCRSLLLSLRCRIPCMNLRNWKHVLWHIYPNPKIQPKTSFYQDGDYIISLKTIWLRINHPKYKIWDMHKLNTSIELRLWILGDIRPSQKIHDAWNSKPSIWLPGQGKNRLSFWEEC
jgi:hypothetical protein